MYRQRAKTIFFGTLLLIAAAALLYYFLFVRKEAGGYGGILVDAGRNWLNSSVCQKICSRLCI